MANQTPDIYRGAMYPNGYDKGFAITPSDVTELANVTRAVYVGGAGNLAVELPNGTVLVFMAVPVGTMLPVRAAKIRSTSTTATNIIGLY